MNDERAFEQRRLQILREYEILDTASEQTFDNLTKLATRICEVPIGLVTLIDSDRQFLKSAVGMETGEMPRKHAFCNYAIQDNDVMVVPDALLDRRFQTNPLVLDDPKIRFYAGAPLEVKKGVRLGALCIIDRIPRTLTKAQLESLQILRDAIVAQLELRLARNLLRQELDVIRECSWCKDVQVGDQSRRWQAMREFLHESFPVSHSMCPKCRNNLCGVVN